MTKIIDHRLSLDMLFFFFVHVVWGWLATITDSKAGGRALQKFR